MNDAEVRRLATPLVKDTSPPGGVRLWQRIKDLGSISLPFALVASIPFVLHFVWQMYQSSPVGVVILFLAYMIVLTGRDTTEDTEAPPPPEVALTQPARAIWGVISRCLHVLAWLLIVGTVAGFAAWIIVVVATLMMGS